MLIYTSDNMPYEKVGDNEPVCISDEVPFEIPEGWEWCRLGELIAPKTGLTYKKEMLNKKNNNMVRVLRGGNIINNNIVIQDNDIMISDEFVRYDIKISKNIFITPAVTSKEQIGKIAFVSKDLIHTTIGGFVFELIPFYNEDILCKMLFYIFNSKYHIDNLKSITHKSGQAFYNISREKMIRLLIPLPPLQEQQRIVSEIEKYLPLINEYDRLQTELDTLDKEFPEKLKKSILQEAIKGKLVEQDKNDEPASVLLDKIRKEKEKLIKEGKIKKDKNESIIYKRDNSYYEKLNGVEKCIDDEIPFEIPASWELARFNSIVNYHMGKTPPRKDSKYWENASHSWISIADMVSDGIIKNTKEKVNDYSVKTIFKNQISKKGTLIMSFKLTVGRVSILDIDAFHNEAIISIIPYYDINNIIRDYLFTFLPLISTYGDTKTAIKGNTLNSTSIDNLIIPIPPINEQYRIIKKIILLLTETKKLTNQL